MTQACTAAWGGIRTAALVYLALCFVFGLMAGEEKFSSGCGMARSVAAVAIIGVGFGLPSLVYETELPMALKVLIHMGIGCLVMTGASILAGWLRPEQGLKPFLAMLGVEIASAFLIWGWGLLRAKRLAKAALSGEGVSRTRVLGPAKLCTSKPKASKRVSKRTAQTVASPATQLVLPRQ